MEISHKYDDIINLPHHVSETRPRMPMIDRAAQFAPFAALTGYGEAVEETARLTDAKLELDEDQKAAVNAVLSRLVESREEHCAVLLTYFIQDGLKSGGRYVTTIARAKKVDVYGGVLLLADGSAIPFDDIYSLELCEREE